MTAMNVDEILKHLPHRYPFMLLDRVLECEPGKRLVAIKNVTYNEPFFTGHFLHKPVMPGVLQLEALAQAAGVLTYRTLGFIPDIYKDLFYLAGIDKARFRRVVVPGDQLRLELTLLQQRKALWKFRGEAFVGDELACSAEILNIKE